MRILLVRLDHMGDIVLTVPPMIAAARDACSDIVLDVLATSAGASLLRDVAGIDRIIVFDPPWSVPPPGMRSTPKKTYVGRSLKFMFAQITRRYSRYDAIIFLSFSPWERFLVSWQGRVRVGFSGPYTRRAFRFSERLLTESISFDVTRHVLDNAFNLIGLVLGGVKKRTTTALPLCENRREYGKSLLQKAGAGKNPTVLIHPGSSESMKAWPFEKYLEVAEKLEAEFGMVPLFIGTPDEVRINRSRLRSESGHGPLFCTTQSVNDLVSVTSNADVFIANDGGPMHMAAALGVPTVAVFGPTDERLYGPRGTRCSVVREKGICGRRQSPWRVDPCCMDTDRECLSGIEVETVLKQVRLILREHTSCQNDGEAALG